MAIFSSPLLLGAIVIAALVVIKSYQTDADKRRRYALIGAGPPKGLPSHTFGIGIAMQILHAMRKHEFWHWTKEILDTNKHTVDVRMFGNSMYLTDDPENIKAIQDTEFTRFKKSKAQHEIFKHILGDAVFSMDGEEWKQEIGFLKTHMSRVRDSDYEITEKHLKHVIDILATPGTDAFDAIDRWQLDVVTHVFCGKSTDSLTSNQQPFRDAMDVLLRIASFRQLMGPVGVWLRDDWLAPRATREIDRYLDRFVDEAFTRTYSGDQPCLIEDYIRMGKGRGVVKNAVISTLLAGKDPTTTTLAWAYYEIARHPHVFAKMKAETQEHIGDRLPTKSDLHKLKYIRNVIKETLRVHHPLGLNARVPAEDMILPRGGGPDGKSPIGVLEGTQIVYGLLSLQQRSDLGVKDVNLWIPERWESWKPSSQWEYIPFNHGPRICPGQQFANFQMEYFLARLCQEFETITLTPESMSQEGKVRIELNTKLAYPIFADAERRTKS